MIRTGACVQASNWWPRLAPVARGKLEGGIHEPCTVLSWYAGSKHGEFGLGHGMTEGHTLIHIHVRVNGISVSQLFTEVRIATTYRETVVLWLDIGYLSLGRVVYIRLSEPIIHWGYLSLETTAYFTIHIPPKPLIPPLHKVFRLSWWVGPLEWFHYTRPRSGAHFILISSIYICLYISIHIWSLLQLVGSNRTTFAKELYSKSLQWESPLSWSKTTSKSTLKLSHRFEETMYTTHLCYMQEPSSKRLDKILHMLHI